MDLDVCEFDTGTSASPVASGSQAFTPELTPAAAEAGTEPGPAEAEPSKKQKSCAPCRIRRVK